MEWGFPSGSKGKESPCNAGDLGLISGLGRSLEEGNGYPLRYFGLENSMDRRASHINRDVTFICDSDHPIVYFSAEMVSSRLGVPGSEPFTTKRVQECHISSQVARVMFSP